MIAKIKPGKRQAWLDWCAELEKQKTLALQTLTEEQLVQETCLVFEDYVLYMHKPQVGKEKLPANQGREINRIHFEKFHECLEVVGRNPETGYDFSVE